MPKRTRYGEIQQTQKPKTKKNIQKPKVTISDIGNFQTLYKSDTGCWLSYTQAAEMLEKMSESKLNQLRVKWAQ